MSAAAKIGRRVLAISGQDRESFLQGLVTNDLAGLSSGIIYAALLSPQGKYLADFFLVDRGETILVDVAEPFADALCKRFSMYRLRADVSIEDTEIVPSRGTTPMPKGAFADPRHPSLGWRLYDDARVETAPVDWDGLRVANCIPETGIELLANESYILESGFERLNGVDFRKGCYVGQEVTARMKHKTTLKKGLATVSVDGAVPVGTEIFADGKLAGTLFTQSHGRAIAYLRFDRATGPMQADGATVTWPA